MSWSSSSPCRLAQKQMRGFIAQLRPMELEGRSLQEALDKWFPGLLPAKWASRRAGVAHEGELSEAKEHQLFLISRKRWRIS